MRQRFTAIVWCVALSAIGCSGDSSGTTLFVDETASAGGDGSRDSPYQTVRDAFEHTGSYDTIAIAPGQYGVPPDWEFPAAVVIQGSIAGATVLVAESDESLRIAWSAPAGALIAVRDLELASALSFRTGRFEAQNLAVAGVTGPGLELIDSDSELFSLQVADIAADPDQPQTGDGVVVSGGTVLWRGGSSTAVADRALILRGSMATVETVSLQSTSRGALTADDGASVDASGISIDGVSVGVFVSGAQISLVDSDVRNAGTAGLLSGPEATVSIEGTVFADCPQGHISVLGSGTSLSVTSSELRNAAEAPCISISSATGDIAVTDNTVDGCAGTGISMLGLSAATISDNRVSNVVLDPLFGTIADGISALDSQVTLARNQISDTAGNGIAMIRSTVTATNNTITGPGGAGISVIDPGPARSMVASNAITGAFGVGVIVLGSSARVESNDIAGTVFNPADSFGDGIAFAAGADVEVVANAITGNAVNGIVFLDGASGEIRDNTATNNAQFGVLELCSGAANSVVVGTNTLTGNTAGDQNLCSM